jgi:hypothetical protein
LGQKGPSLPEFVRVLGHNYKIVLVNGLLNDFSDYGRVNLRTHAIEIDSSTPYSKQLETLVHEVLEIVNDQMSLILEHDKLQIIAACMYAFLMDNAGDVTF